MDGYLQVGSGPPERDLPECVEEITQRAFQKVLRREASRLHGACVFWLHAAEVGQSIGRGRILYL